MKEKVAGASARLLLMDKEAAEIAHDQERLRENIKALTSTAEAKQLIARYVSKANEQKLAWSNSKPSDAQPMRNAPGYKVNSI